MSDQIAREGERERRQEEEFKVEREPPELTVSRERTPIFDSLVYENIGRKKGLTLWDLEYEISGFAKISPVTARRRIKQLIGMSIIRLGEGPRGHRQILWALTEEEKQKEKLEEAKAEVRRLFGKEDNP